jgi:hypothetical protein
MAIYMRSVLSWPLCGAACLWLAVAPALASQPTGQVEELDEITIEGKKLYQLRMAVTETEDRFYKLFNELNTNDDYDVQCANQAPTGSRITRRVCKPVFYANAEAEYAQALVGGYYAPPATMVALERTDEYQKAMREMVERNPKLRRLLIERDRLERNYIKARKERFKGRLILSE